MKARRVTRITPWAEPRIPGTGGTTRPEIGSRYVTPSTIPDDTPKPDEFGFSRLTPAQACALTHYHLTAVERVFVIYTGIFLALGGMATHAAAAISNRLFGSMQS